MTLGGSNSESVAQEVADFAERMTPAEPRWQYALDRSTYLRRSPQGQTLQPFNARTLPTVARFLGVSTPRASLRLRRIRDLGSFDLARQWFLKISSDEPMLVGPMQPWLIGHVYFAQLQKFPHVVKVGFSRRVAERIEDIECKVKQPLFVNYLRVGTMADEHWWHHSWRDLRISGEWFYWPRTTERSLPDFLQPAREAA